MHKPGWDARRRNRNIGTAKSGYGKDNRLTIPESWADERLFYESYRVSGVDCIIGLKLRDIRALRCISKHSQSRGLTDGENPLPQTMLLNCSVSSATVIK
ncbi:hypothetical protein [Lusitaniella coriacea]|uniref:hypothetical protein n=1 Tax=Lusitaniella coriacea TaxID=1983105 RepID=UPI003CF8C700